MKTATTLGVCALALLTGMPTESRGEQPPAAPQFNPKGELLRPLDYREWVYLTSGLGMSYGVNPPSDDHPNFDNVFVHPAAYRTFVKTGHWPDKTMFILELRTSQTHGSINKSGHFQTKVAAVEAAVKDVGRFKEKWAYFSFGTGDSLNATAKAFPGDSRCNVCHSKNAAVENTFVQFYPTLLEIAKAKGTLNPGFVSE